MKQLLITLFFIFAIQALGCTGDCMTCHPALLKNIDADKRHKPMTTCIKCHTANTEKMADCGSDCFACHPVAKIELARVREHEVIRECRDCHMKLKAMVQIDTLPAGQSTQTTLRDFLKP